MPSRLTPALLVSLPLLLAACGQAEWHPAALSAQSQETSTPTLESADQPSLEEGEAPLPQIGIDEGVFMGRPGTDTTEPGALGGQDFSAQATYLTCRNEPSGPYLRLQTDPERTGPVNFVEGAAHLPPVKATATAFPYVYLGGQPREGVAADAGVYVNYDGSWIPFVAVAGPGGARNLPRETDAQGRVFVYRLDGHQDVSMRLSVLRDGELTLDVTGTWVKFQLVGTQLTRVGVTGEATRRITHPLAGGWKASGADQVYKVMTTIAFPGKGNFALLTQNYSFLGSSWRDLGVGRTDTPSGKEWRVPFTKARLYSACNAPADVVTPTRTSALPRASAAIELRRRTQAQFSATTFNLTAKVQQAARDAVTVTNTGPLNSWVRYSALPLGQAERQGRALEGALAAGENARVDFMARCPAQPGPSVQAFNVLHSTGETYTATSGPSALPGARPGDLLYRTAPVTVNMNCTAD